MADYTVSIALAAKVSDYVRGMETAARATNNLRNAQQGTARSSAALAAELTAAGAAGKASAGGMNNVTREVRSLERAHRKLNETRTAGGGKGNNPLDSLIPDPRKLRRAGQSGGESFVAGLSQAFKGGLTSPGMITLLTSAAVTAAPIAGAALVGGVLGAIGTGAIGAGFAASLRAPQVKGAIADLKSDLGHLGDDISKDFAGPVRHSIQMARASIRSLGPDIRSALAPAAGYLAPLTRGLTGLVANVVPGLQEAVRSAKPVFDVISSELPQVGASLSGFFQTMADHANEGAAAVKEILDGVEGLVSAGGAVLGWLSAAYVKMLQLQVAVTKAESGLPGIFGQKARDLNSYWNGLLKTAQAGDTAAPAVAAVANSAGQLTAQQRLLNSSLHDGIAAAGGFAQALDAVNAAAATSEQAEIDYQGAVDGVTESIKRNGKSLDVHTEKGRANRTALLAVSKAVQEKAKAVYDDVAATGDSAAAEQAAAAVLQQGRGQLVKSARQYGLSKSAAEKYADSILKIPRQWDTRISTSGIDKATGKVRTLEQELASMRTNWDITIRTHFLTFGKPYSAAGIASGNIGGLAHGGVLQPMAYGGVGQVYPASNPPLYRFAEPETGGELFLPRKGSKERGRDLLSVGASWYGMRVVPLAQGGIQSAATGLVNVAPSTTGGTTGTRLDTLDAYLQYRDAVTSLNRALKDNGRSFSLSTSKGRENRAALLAGIRAAQDAAKAKFDETGNIRLANAAYDAYIARLRTVLERQRYNSREVRGLLSVAQRPTYDVSAAGPRNSANNITFARSAIGVQDSLQQLRDTLSLSRPTTSLGSVEGRQNLGGVLDFLEAASSAAQDRYAQTGSSRSAAALYNRYVAWLRSSLTGAGYAKSAIAKLIAEFGHITLSSNAAGGVYPRLDGAMALGSGSTLYGWREPSTGGEAFVPRFGDRARSQRVLQVAAGWYGGSYIPPGSGGSGASHSTNLTVNNYTRPLTVADYQGLQRQADVKARVGRPR